MDPNRPITVWLGDLKAGDDSAAQKIWEQYYERLVRLARKKLEGASRRVADEEDVALDAFHTFCEGAKTGRFPQLNDRQDLWKLLVVITARQASALRRHGLRQKRGAGTVRGESVFLHDGSTDRNSGIERVLGDEPTPEYAALVAEEYRRLLGSLAEESLREIAMLKMAGYGTDEIAQKLACTPRTIQRKLELIRAQWAQEAGG